jgi:hypothetical protein
VAPKRKPAVNEAEEVSRLIGDIYDASLDPSLWSTVFAAATKYIGGSAAHLSARDMVGRSSHGYFASGHDPRFLEIYHEKYFRINPLFPTMVFFDVERTLSIADCLPHEDFCRSQFAREWVVPQGFIDTAISNVEKSATGCSTFTVMRGITDGLPDDEFRRRFGLIVPHVRRALLIGNVIAVTRSRPQHSPTRSIRWHPPCSSSTKPAASFTPTQVAMRWWRKAACYARQLAG